MKIRPTKLERVTFNDVRGYESEKQELMDLCDLLNHLPELKKTGNFVPKGVILAGPPGVGKTLMAKALACESNAMLLEINFSETHFSILNNDKNICKTINSVFNQARKYIKKNNYNKPCIIFIDELDRMVPNEYSSMQTDASKQALSCLLTNIDGSLTSEGIVAVATTNNIYDIHSALTRSGRMDKHIICELPKLKERKDILNYYLEKYHISSEKLDIDYICEFLSGCSGADIKNIVNEISCYCYRPEYEISNTTFFNKIQNVKMGDISRPLTLQEKKTSAVHEAGHAFVYYALYNSYCNISLNQSGDSSGRVFTPVEKMLGHNTDSEDETDSLLDFLSDNESNVSTIGFSIQNYKNIIMVSLGGKIAQEIVFGSILSGASGDLKTIKQVFNSIIEEQMLIDWSAYCPGDNIPMPFFDGAGAPIYNENSTAILMSEYGKIMQECTKQVQYLLNNNIEVFKLFADFVYSKEICTSLDMQAFFTDPAHKINTSLSEEKNEAPCELGVDH